MSYTSVFGGTTIYPSDVSYLALALGADKALEWPLESNDPTNPAARVIDVTTSGSYSITLPDATQTGAGQTILFNNLSASTNSFTLKDYAGGTIATVGVGEQWQVYLAATTTAAGTWRVFRYGASTATVQASALAGYGLTVTANTLSQAMTVTTFNSSPRTVLTTDRSSALVWNGTGTGTLNLLSAVTAGNNFFIAVRNSGGGDLTVDAAGSETIDGLPTLLMRPGESTNLITDGITWYTLGFGQEAVFAFDYTSITVTGGTYTLAGSELNRIAYKFVGTLSADQYIVVPSTIQQYWVDNATTGAYSFYLQTSGGTPIAVAQGARGIYYCNGANVVDADTSTISLPVSATDGGTGQTSYTTGDLLYANSTTSLAKLSDVATGNALISGGVGVIPAWGKIGLTTHVSGTLPVANGGTGATNATDARTNLSAAKTGVNGDITQITALADGGASGPAVTFTSESNTGMYRVGAGSLGFSVLGTIEANITSAGVNVPAGNDYRINGASVLSATTLGSGVTASSLTSVGTLTSGALGSGFTTVAVAQGGTGQTSYTTGDLLYANSTTTLAKLSDVATGNALISGGVGVIPSWGKIGLTTHVSGTLAVGNGGTGATTLTSNGVLYGNGTSAVAATAAGTTGQVLVGNTGSAPSWAALTSSAVTSLSFGTTGLTPSTATQGAITVAGTLAVANGGTGVTTSTGTGSVVLSTSPTLVTPTLGAASATSIANALGAAGTPSYTFTGDLNTGMWSPGADTVAVSTGGSERMRITSAGNVGVGTTTPDANGKVDILGNIDPGTTVAALSVRNTGVAGGTAAAQYGIRVSSQTYNNASASYGVYAFSYQNTGNATYGVWGDAGSSSLVGNSTQPFYGVVGRAYFNSAASHALTSGNLPVGVYGTVVSTGSTNTATSAAGYFTNAATFGAAAYGIYVNATSGPTSVFLARFDLGGTELVRIDSTGGVLSSGTGGIGYRTGAGGTVTQATSRTTGVTLNKTSGAITLVSAAGTATWQSFTVTNSTVAATDVIKVCQKSGTDLYMIHVTNVAAGSFQITFATTGGTTTEQPVFNFAVIKGATS